MAAPPQDLSRLTRSARTAMAWATLRAAERTPVGNQMSKGDYGAPPIVTVPDLLTGILLSHPGSSEPAVLLRHAGLPEDRLYATSRRLRRWRDTSPDPPGTIPLPGRYHL